jgi:hypothetical protein
MEREDSSWSGFIENSYDLTTGAIEVEKNSDESEDLDDEHN